MNQPRTTVVAGGQAISDGSAAPAVIEQPSPASRIFWGLLNVLFIGALILLVLGFFAWLMNEASSV